MYVNMEMNLARCPSFFQHECSTLITLNKVSNAHMLLVHYMDSIETFKCVGFSSKTL